MTCDSDSSFMILSPAGTSSEPTGLHLRGFSVSSREGMKASARKRRGSGRTCYGLGREVRNSATNPPYGQKAQRTVLQGYQATRRLQGTTLPSLQVEATSRPGLRGPYSVKVRLAA